MGAWRCQGGRGTIENMRQVVKMRCCECDRWTVGATGRGPQRCPDCSVRRATLFAAIQYQAGQMSTTDLERWLGLVPTGAE